MIFNIPVARTIGDSKIWLFKDGVINTALTGGFNGLELDSSTGYLAYDDTITNGRNKHYTTQKSVDLTSISTIHLVIGTKAYSGSLRYVRNFADASERNGTNLAGSGLDKYVSRSSFTGGEFYELVLDVTEYNKKMYVGVGFGVSANESGSQRATAYYIREWWME